MLHWPRVTLLSLALSVSVGLPIAFAQSPLERIVGPDAEGHPILVQDFFGISVSAIGRAARVPIGVEFRAGDDELPQGGPRFAATGYPLRAVLNALISLKPGYEWREIDGVIVIRPTEAWGASTYPRNTPVRALSIQGIRTGEALTLAAAALGSRQRDAMPASDTKRFSCEFEGGSAID